ncbi:MAG: DNA adenine methylase [Chloroflexi bacterium]|nr:DNA adenine methylase [Chloroflexota bacterium]
MSALAPEAQPIEERLACFPSSRYMGSKQALLPFLRPVLADLPVTTVLDAFSGSAAVSYLLKAMGKSVVSNDYLAIAYHTAAACVANSHTRLAPATVEQLLTPHPAAGDFVQRTFAGLYFTDEENRLLDHILAHLIELDDDATRSLAIAAVVRACLRRRPRGIFTYTGLRYDDGRRDLRTSLAQHIRDAAERFNAAVFDTGQPQRAAWGDIFDLALDPPPDLVYIDPPYASPLSDNDYSRRYHFVEGLARAWSGLTILPATRTRKFARLPTRFDRLAAIDAALADLFDRYRDSILVVSYASNALPDHERMLTLLRAVKRRVIVHGIDHRYSFGTHGQRVGDNRNQVREFLFVGQ